MGDVVDVKLIKETIGHEQKFNFYLNILHSFFTFKISYEVMKCQIENLLTLQEVKLHNDFICTVMKKTCIGPHRPVPHSTEVGPNPSQKDKAKRKATEERRVPRRKISAYHQLQSSSAIMATCVPRITPELADAFSMCPPLGAFPDARYMYGTLLVHASSKDLGVPEICAIYVTVAVKEFIKNILSGIFSTRDATRRLNYFPYAASHRNSLSQTSSTLPSSSATTINTSMSKPGQLLPEVQSTGHLGKSEATKTFRFRTQSHVFSPVNVHELYDCIMIKTEIIPISAIRTRALEYCIMKLRESNF